MDANRNQSSKSDDDLLSDPNLLMAVAMMKSI